ncbi:MAG TPA: nuclear transport factor 2 family protein [Terriglobia bacterium]|nr:nuclear transport factor 2 family protein [Terriglobia bacterium]
MAIAVLALGLLPQQSQESPDVSELLRLESVWNEAHEKGDASVLEKLWGDDLEVTVPRMPVMLKADALAFARSGRMKFQRYQTSDVKVRVYGDAALVSGRLQRTRTLNGKTLDDDWRFLKVYLRREARWQVVAFQASEAPQP